MQTLRETLANAQQRLNDAWTERGAFCGMLSPSALSTATAAMAFELGARATGDADYARLAAGGRAWLVAHQNPDGGFGDTPASPSNISTTTLGWASLGLDPEPSAEALRRIEAWLTHACGELTPRRLAATIRARYGKDHTFSVPILTTCALADRLGDAGWRLVPSLPFELAACPPRWFQWLRMPTVSYALPALIAIGQARHHHRPTRNPVTRVLRHLTRRRTLRVLRDIQPSSGGYLEAAPLTSFVSMSLISMGLAEHPVVRSALGFLRDTVRDDGCWPIDTNLDTWLTTLTVGALGDQHPVAGERLAKTRAWLLGQQYLDVHPYTRAAPGGWAWTDLPGGVPDADDTAGALLAIHALCGAEATEQARRGVSWLLDLQNRDGGIPTFCRGWGTLPFDRSGADLTAHALRAWHAWRESLPELRERIDRASAAAVSYLLRTQRADGSWIPLWFGNQQQTGEEENPMYGTTRVLRAIRTVPAADPAWHAAGERGVRWVRSAQDEAGGFGGAPGLRPSIEETALAVEALAEWSIHGGDGPLLAAIERGASWLEVHTERGTRFDASPIGLYFAKLWYDEQLYPIIFTASALDLARRCLAPAARSQEAR